MIPASGRDSHGSFRDYRQHPYDHPKSTSPWQAEFPMAKRRSKSFLWRYPHGSVCWDSIFIQQTPMWRWSTLIAPFPRTAWRMSVALAGAPNARVLATATPTMPRTTTMNNHFMITSHDIEYVTVSGGSHRDDFSFPAWIFAPAVSSGQGPTHERQ